LGMGKSEGWGEMWGVYRILCLCSHQKEANKFPNNNK
jgi:hypothetical protein